MMSQYPYRVHEPRPTAILKRTVREQLERILAYAVLIGVCVLAPIGLITMVTRRPNTLPAAPPPPPVTTVLYGNMEIRSTMTVHIRTDGTMDLSCDDMTSNRDTKDGGTRLP
jgi:hypothetical protein